MTMVITRPDPFGILPDSQPPQSQAHDFIAQRLSEGWLLSDLHSFAWGDREDARRYSAKAAMRMGGAGGERAAGNAATAAFRYQFLDCVVGELDALRKGGMDLE